MGLLDDAIKQHLELKRKHGAGEDEVKRQEAEALGPARRDFAGSQHAPEEADAAGSEPVPPEPEQPRSWLDEEEEAVPSPIAETVVHDPPPPETPESETVLEPDEVLDPEPEPVREEPPAPVERRSETPTQGFPAVSRDEPVDDEDGDVDDVDDEDVLEETPEFLQDTPEHDRLWFEQKPPRDFDFDG